MISVVHVLKCSKCMNTFFFKTYYVEMKPKNDSELRAFIKTYVTETQTVGVNFKSRRYLFPKLLKNLLKSNVMLLILVFFRFINNVLLRLMKLFDILKNYLFKIVTR